MIISQKALEAIKANIPAKAALMVAFNRTHKTIENWIREADIMLTTKQALDIISEHTGMTEAEILETEKASA